jgi:hypothetical protein
LTTFPLPSTADTRLHDSGRVPKIKYNKLNYKEVRKISTMPVCLLKTLKQNMAIRDTYTQRVEMVKTEVTRDIEKTVGH